MPNAADTKLLQKIRDTYDYFMDQWSDQREAAKKDTLLMANKPFTDAEVRRRGKNRPLVLTDQVGQYTNQIINNIRQNPRGVNFQPMDLKTNSKDAEKRANIARQIEKQSDAQAAYSTAFEGAVAYGGMGFLRLSQEYESNDTDRQVLLIDRVPNQFSILPDPDCKKIDFSDMKRCFVLDQMSHTKFNEEHSEAKEPLNDAAKNAYPKWIRDTNLTMAEYWEVIKRPDTLLIMETGSIRLSKLPEGARFIPNEEPEQNGGVIESENALPVMVRKTRKLEVPEVWQYHTNGIEVFERNCWEIDSDSIPIYPVVGREMYVDDGSGPKKQYVSAVRFCSWAVKGMAYVRSLQTELAQMTPKTPYLAIEGQLEGMEGWKTLHTDPAAYLYYRAKLEAFGDLLLPPPGRVPYDPPIAQLEGLYQAFHQDLQNAMGMYRASVGNQAGSNSGKMVQELDKQSDQGSFHFTHNFNQSLERLWTDINRRMDKVYDTVREVGSIRPDGSYQALRLNDPSDPDALHMGRGQFSVSISIGPAMESETEDAREFISKLVEVPGVFEKVGYLLVKMGLKGPIGDEVAKALTPAGQGDGENPAQLQQQLQEAGKELQTLQEQLQEAGKIIQTKQIESASKKEIAEIQAAASIEVARTNAAAKLGGQGAQLDADLIKHATSIEADAEAQQAEHEHAAEQQELAAKATAIDNSENQEQ